MEMLGMDLCFSFSFCGSEPARITVYILDPDNLIGALVNFYLLAFCGSSFESKPIFCDDYGSGTFNLAIFNFWERNRT